jgi:hypothetical protein
MPGLAKRVHAKILQASTSEAYGDPTVHPQTEEYWGHVNPAGLRSSSTGCCRDRADPARKSPRGLTSGLVVRWGG